MLCGPMNYADAIEYLLSLPDMERTDHPDKAKRMSLDSMRRLLSLLDFPQKGRKTVHVTGSKGKGSTSAYMASLLASRHKVSLYSSPHLHSYLERICFNLAAVEPEDFAAALAFVKAKGIESAGAELGTISTFGAMTAMFFHLSRQKRADWQVVEVGMGGTYDATNVLERTELVIMTAMSLEHTRVLGSTIAEIATNKAGIIKEKSQVVLAPQSDKTVSSLIAAVCAEKPASLIDMDRNCRLEMLDFGRQSQSFSFVHANGKKSKYQIRMLGEHQLRNAATALVAIEALESQQEIEALSESEKQESLEQVFVPGRLELLAEKPALLIDGAHNGDSAAALVRALKRHYKVRECTFILGLNSDKNVEDILRAIAEITKDLVVCRSKSEKAMEPGIIAARAGELGLKVSVASGSTEALALAQNLSGADGLVCATGSLYLIAELREYIKGPSPEWSLRRQKASSCSQASDC